MAAELAIGKCSYVVFGLKQRQPILTVGKPVTTCLTWETKIYSRPKPKYQELGALVLIVVIPDFTAVNLNPRPRLSEETSSKSSTHLRNKTQLLCPNDVVHGSEKA